MIIFNLESAQQASDYGASGSLHQHEQTHPITSLQHSAATPRSGASTELTRPRVHHSMAPTSLGRPVTLTRRSRQSGLVGCLSYSWADGVQRSSRST